MDRPEMATRGGIFRGFMTFLMGCFLITHALVLLYILIELDSAILHSIEVVFKGYIVIFLAWMQYSHTHTHKRYEVYVTSYQ